ncbi:dTDP-4-dehydrorhamnose 3,5-epimerase [Maribacter litopenaei]|uniref:dTDP-4-dehydrorhamnose 3,5-epimerase n=1 Tax=Maribacter litopenaei TaxID=2976127 RepID=A0ABY5YAS1_9FLAO|nr:dTDP-4-dehydrorhamnose 3,5-epimerase [Maribacter litopenaei]UWX55427.1 dTDP-4-dehydrorhamnose 3,5-epimerase [Maribacter litopenaei]
MQINKTNIEGCYEMKPEIFKDQRGFFFESFNKKRFEQLTGLKVAFVQDNQAFSTHGVLRGLHFQKGESAQAKLVRVIQGEVLDVVVDIRRDSPTYGNFFKTILSSENHKQLFIPGGCAHGYVTLSNSATFFYKCDNHYNPGAESGIAYNDPTLNIDWEIPDKELILSEKDRILPKFDDLLD